MLRRRQWHPTRVLLPGISHGWRSLVGCSPWGHGGSDTTERLHFHASEKEMATHSSVLAWRIPGMGGASWAAVYGVTQSQTRLKRLSSSSRKMLTRQVRQRPDTYYVYGAGIGFIKGDCRAPGSSALQRRDIGISWS